MWVKGHILIKNNSKVLPRHKKGLSDNKSYNFQPQLAFALRAIKSSLERRDAQQQIPQPGLQRTCNGV